MVDFTNIQEKRRVIATLWRVYTSSGDAQYRALDRLAALVDEAYATEVWLSTGPDPEIVSQVLSYRLMLESPLRLTREPMAEVYRW